MPTLTYRHPSEPLQIVVLFDGEYAVGRPVYFDRVDFGYPTPYNTQHTGPAARVEPAKEVGSLDDLYRAMHALADFLSADAEAYVAPWQGSEREYCTRADVAEHAYRHADELSELALFLSERESYARLVAAAPDVAEDLQDFYESLSVDHRATWDLFTAPSTAADHMWQRFTYTR